MRSRIWLIAVEDHPLLRDGLKGMLASQPDREVAGEAANGEEAVALAGRLRPDVVLMDLRMPVLDGGTRRLKPLLDTEGRLRYTSLKGCGDGMTGRSGTSMNTVTSAPARVPWLILLASLVLAAGCSVGTGQGLPPTVFTTTPADGSGNVPVTATIAVTFSRPMDAVTVTSSTFTLTQNGIAIPGSVACSGKTATFTPTNNLPGNSIFTGTITTAAKDAAGVAVATDRVWTFMTVPIPTANNIVLYYTYTTNGGAWTRTSSPLTLTNGANTVSQSFNPTDGSVTITILNAPLLGYEDNGFYLSVGSLQ